MKSNTTFEEIGKKLTAADSVLIFTHVNPDPDALGSSIGLCTALRERGVEAFAVFEEMPEGYGSFLLRDCCTTDADCVENPEICVCVDGSEESRLGKLISKFNSGKCRICIDHHGTSDSFGDLYCIDGDEPAASQMVFKLLRTMGVEIAGDIAYELYAGISGDTGSFKYDSTTPETMRIAAEIMESGIGINDINVNLYQNVSRAEAAIESAVIGEAEFFAGDEAVISRVTSGMLAEAGAVLHDAEGAIDRLRNIAGVEIAVLVKEQPEGNVKLSLRSKRWADVGDIAAGLGGGGHVRAAGCTLDMGVQEAVDKLKKIISDYLEK